MSERHARTLSERLDSTFQYRIHRTGGNSPTTRPIIKGFSAWVEAFSVTPSEAAERDAPLPALPQIPHRITHLSRLRTAYGFQAGLLY
jgi:hypothetical protein